MAGLRGERGERAVSAGAAAGIAARASASVLPSGSRGGARVMARYYWADAAKLVGWRGKFWARLAFCVRRHYSGAAGPLRGPRRPRRARMQLGEDATDAERVCGAALLLMVFRRADGQRLLRALVGT